MKVTCKVEPREIRIVRDVQVFGIEGLSRDDLRGLKKACDICRKDRTLSYDQQEFYERMHERFIDALATSRDDIL